jgi:Domain of unknown function (DUF4386)
MSQVIDRPQVATPRLTRTQAVVVVAAPAVAVLARLLTTPWYQDDNNQPDDARVLTEIADAVARNEVGAVLALLSAVLFAVAAIVVGGIVRAGSPRVGWAGLVLAGIGAFGLAVFSTFVAVITVIAQHDDREAMLELMAQINDSPIPGVSYSLLILGALGWIILGYGLYRSSAIPRAAAVLSALGGAGVMLTTPGPLTSFIAGSAVLCLLGFAWVALAARRS